MARLDGPFCCHAFVLGGFIAKLLAYQTPDLTRHCSQRRYPLRYFSLGSISCFEASPSATWLSLNSLDDKHKLMTP